jgi:hypothetical protein
MSGAFAKIGVEEVAIDFFERACSRTRSRGFAS